MPQHRVELMQVLDARQEPGKNFLQVADTFHAVLAVFLHQSFFVLRSGTRQTRNVDHELLALWQELMQWWVKQPDRNRRTIHSFEQTDKVSPLHRQQLLQRNA